MEGYDASVIYCHPYNAPAKPSKHVYSNLSSAQSRSHQPPATSHSYDMTDTTAQALAGHPLPPPSIHPTDWFEGQQFSTSDDPDRTDPTLYPWSAPKFLAWKNPADQIPLTTVEELDVKGAGVQGFREGHSFARAVHNVLTPEECWALLEKVNAKGFTPALLNVGMGVQAYVPAVRDGLRVIVDSEALAKYLFEIVKAYLPQTLQKGGMETQLVEFNERCRFLCYKPGQQFEPHCDGRYTRSEPHPHANDYSMVTVQFYLHDVLPANGGATTFLGHPHRYHRRVFGQSGKLPFQPRAGSVLIFTQDLLHEGSEVVAGFKYTMRTEAMYRTVLPEES